MKTTAVVALVVGLLLGAVGAGVALVVPYIIVGGGDSVAPSAAEVAEAVALRDADARGWAGIRAWIGFSAGFLVGVSLVAWQEFRRRR